MVTGADLALPFFDEAHRALAAQLERWVSLTRIADDEQEPETSCQAWVRALADEGLVRACVPDFFGGLRGSVDVRTLCLIRERLAQHSALADFAFAMQGLGSAPVTFFGSNELQRRILPGVVEGKLVAAFALSERAAGSDVAALEMRARPEGTQYVLDGEKTWISNAGLADFYVVFARTGAAGSRGLSAFVVEADAAGLSVTQRIETISPHPLGSLRFDGVRVRTADRIGNEGDGFKIAMTVLDTFRSTVGAAALGFARRALAESIAHVTQRKLFGAPLAALQMTQAAIAGMALDVDASALLVYRAAWTKDNGAARVTREAAMAKWFATEAAGRVCDRAVQLFGGRGVTRGEIVERLYRDVRALRIYEGASEIQQVVIAKQLLDARA
ncbi:MAG: acyl-CoA dehydrogenase family protein [Candidatus Eremiobacteraeota bacterium]|nr:acyl-CoA dehydrogenase family protein [Candidatus Eremiobacteraeota bacterium]MBV8371997.1 acyl-CoA dehydrogenase family protein [Candidatus Eremiobacteraeota bacterium]